MNYLKRLLISGATLLLPAFMIAPSALAATGYTWTDQSSLTGNSATSGPAWKSVAVSSDGQHIIAVDQPTFFPVLGGGDIWISADGGTSWTDESALPANSSTSGLNWTSVASSADGQKLIAVSQGNGVWSSLDGGATWTDVANFTMSGGNWESVAMSADGKYMTAMPFNGDVWASSDYGVTWVNDTWIPGNGATHQNWTSVASSADGQKIIGGVNGGSLWISKDDGNTWTDISTLPGNSGLGNIDWYSIASSANGENLVAVVNGGDIYTSNDGGTTWIDESSLPANSGTSFKFWYSVSSSADGKNLAAVEGGGDIWTSSDSGATWTDVTSSGPLRNLQWSAIASNITGGQLTAVVGDFGSGGDIYAGINTNIPQVITASVANPVTSAAVAIQLPSNTTLTCSSGVTEASLAAQDSGYTYPLGLVNLCYTTVLRDDQVSLTFVTDLTPSQVVARDFNTVTHTYTTIPGAAITEVTSGGHHALQLTYTITDNGALDSNPAVSFVTDPVGLALIPSPVTAPDTGYGMPGKSDLILSLMVMGALISTGAGITLLYRHKQHTQA